MAIFPGSAIPSAVSDYEIDNSLRFDDGDSAYLSRTPSATGDTTTWTLSFWAKWAGDNTRSDVFSAGTPGGGNAFVEIGFRNDDFRVVSYYPNDSSAQIELVTTQLFRDPSAWYHFCISVDTNQGTSSDRVKLYVNGEQVTAFATATYPSSGQLTSVNRDVSQAVGRFNYTSGNHYNGYLAEFYLVDGTALDADSFGELDSTTNQWKPLDSDDVKDAVTFGANGFFQKYNSTELAASFEDSADYHSTFTITRNGSPVTKTGVKKFGTASCLLANTGGTTDQWLKTTPSPDWDFPGDVTVECWVKIETSAGYQGIIASKLNGYDGWSIRTDISGSNKVASFNFYNDSASATFACLGTSDIGDGDWHHVAGVRGGSTVRIFVDGVQENSLTYSGTIHGASSGGYGLQVGMDYLDNTGSGPIHAYVDEVRISKGVARYNSNFSVATSAFTADAYTSLLLHMDGADDGTTFTDSSWVGNGGASRHTITANGDATNQRPQPHDVTANGNAHLIGPKQGTSVISYDGTGDYLSIPDSSDWDFGTDNFTIEMWLNTRDSSGYNGGVFSHWTDANNHHEIYLVDNDIYWQCLVSGSHIFPGLAVSTVVTPENGWAHYAFVRNGTTFTIYKNGVAGDSATDATGIPALAAALEIGRIEGGSQYYTGYIDSYRISDSARYTADFTAPTSAFVNDGNTKLLIQSGTDGSQTFDDLSTPDHTITANGDVRWFAPKIGAGAMAFDGTGDYFTAPNSESWDFGTGDFTIETWVKFNSIGSDEGLISQRTTGSGFQWVYDTNHFELWAYDGTEYQSSTFALSAHTWYHVVVTRDGDTLRHYVDGVQKGTNAFTETMSNASTTLQIGAWKDDGSGSPNAYFDCVRISKLCRYPDGTTFDVPTTAFTDDINTALILNADINQGTWAEDTSTGLAISTESRIEFDGSTDSLSIPSSSDFNMADDSWTIDFWVNFKAIPDNDYIFSQYTASGNRWDAYIYNNSGTLEWTYQINDAANFQMTMADSSISTGTWYHVELGVDASTEKGYWYFDGVRQTESSSWTSTNPDVDAAFYIFNPGPSIDVSKGINGYMDEFRVSKGIIRHTGATFTPETRGNPYTADSYTKLLIHSDYTGGLGADSSGNYNNFTATNLVATDQCVDTPTNNFAIMNPINPCMATYLGGNGQPTFSNVNTTFQGPTGSGGAGYCYVTSTISAPSGKWYCEFRQDTSTDGNQYAIAKENYAGGTYNDFYDANAMYYHSNGHIYNATVDAYTGASLTTGDIVGVAFDVDAKTAWFAKNNTWQGSGTQNPATDAGGYDWTFTDNIVFGWADGHATNQPKATVNFGSDSSFVGTVTAQGNQDGNEKGDFYYAPPSGYLALCTDNLSDPEIALPGDHFDTVLWTGNSSTQTVTSSLGFQPDFLWTKVYSHTDSHILRDVVRDGSTTMVESLRSNSSAAQYTSTGSLTTSSNGFSVSGHDGGEFNYNTYNYVTWNWYAPTSVSGSTVSSGTAKTYSGKANADAGFSITKYEGNGTNYHWVPHSLGVTPELAIVRKYGDSAAEQWPVLAWSFTSDIYQVLKLDVVGAEANAGSGGATNAAPNATYVKFGLDDYVNSNGVDMIMYCFASIEGYSKVGSYEGNANADGPFVYTGFSPSFVMVKGIDTSDNWAMWDNKRPGYNVTNKELNADDPAAESANAPDIDFTSNGFKRRDTSMNAASTYLYIAFAESPMKYSLAR